jgi:hypothetical protein
MRGKTINQARMSFRACSGNKKAPEATFAQGQRKGGKKPDNAFY